MFDPNTPASQPQASREVGTAAALAAKAAEHPVGPTTVSRAPQQPRLTAWDYVQIDRLMRARRRAARR